MLHRLLPETSGGLIGRLHTLFCLTLMAILVTGVMSGTSQADTHTTQPKSAIIVLYKDKNGILKTTTNDSGVLDLALDQHPDVQKIRVGARGLTDDWDLRTTYSGKSINKVSLDLGDDFANTPVNLHWTKSEDQPRQSDLFGVSRLLIPLVSAGTLLGGQAKGGDYGSTNLNTNIGHFMVMATVNNLADFVDAGMTTMLQSHNMGGVISQEWLNRGVIAVLMLTAGGIKSVKKNDMTLLDASQFYAQSRMAKESNILLGEISGKALDQVITLPEKYRKIVNSVAGGVESGLLYYLLSSWFTDAFDNSRDLHSKISNASVYALHKSLLPIIDDYSVNLICRGYFNTSQCREVQTRMVTTLAFTIPSAGVFYLVSYKLGPATKAGYLAKLIAGSFAKISGYNFAAIAPKLVPRSDRYPGLSLAGRATALTITTVASNYLYGHAISPAYKPNSDLLSEPIGKVRDGIYGESIAAGVTSLIDDFVWLVEGRKAARAEKTLYLGIEPETVRNDIRL